MFFPCFYGLKTAWCSLKWLYWTKKSLSWRKTSDADNIWCLQAVQGQEMYLCVMSWEMLSLPVVNVFFGSFLVYDVPDMLSEKPVFPSLKGSAWYKPWRVAFFLGSCDTFQRLISSFLVVLSALRTCMVACRSLQEVNGCRNESRMGGHSFWQLSQYPLLAISG